MFEFFLYCISILIPVPEAAVPVEEVERSLVNPLMTILHDFSTIMDIRSQQVIQVSILFFVFFYAWNFLRFLTEKSLGNCRLRRRGRIRSTVWRRWISFFWKFYPEAIVRLIFFLRSCSCQSVKFTFTRTKFYHCFLFVVGVFLFQPNRLKLFFITPIPGRVAHLARVVPCPWTPTFATN